MFLWPAFPWSLTAHQGDAADLRLLAWIKHVLDQVIDVGPWTMVVGVGLIIVAIPLTVVAIYLYQTRRSAQGLDDAA